MPMIRTRLRKAVATAACAAIAATGVGALAAPASAVVACPSDTANGRFVRFTYLMILNRCPDDAGAAYWTAQLDGGLPRATFTDIIDMSDENVLANNVDQLYQQVLGRPPTAQERADGAVTIRSTHGDALLIATLASSDEAYNKLTGTPAEKDAAWLGSAYQNILDRAGDSGGTAFYSAILGNPSTAASRMQVAMMLEHSAENAADWSAAALGAGLNRQPDGGGIAYWSGWLLGPGNWQTFRMWTLILASDEGYARAQTQPGLPVSERTQLARAGWAGA